MKRTVTRAKLGIAILIAAAVIAGALVTEKIKTTASIDKTVDPVDSAVVEPITRPQTAATPVSNIPPQTSAIHVGIKYGEKHELKVATGIDSFIMVTPEIAGVEQRDRFTLNITPLKLGESILLITYGKKRYTYVIEVLPRPSESARTGDGSAIGPGGSKLAATGSFTTMYGQGFEGSSSVIRQNFDYRQPLAGGKSLRVSGELFKSVGGGSRDLAFAQIQNFGLNRLELGIDTPTKSIDLLDSRIDLSTQTLNNFTMRGFHLAPAAKRAGNTDLPPNGVEVFAGIARPSLSLYENGGGMIAGVIVPVVTGWDFEARVGVIAISPPVTSRQGHGGVVLTASGAYAPNKTIYADGEISLSDGDLSARARLDLKFAKYGASAELSHFAYSSPLNSIGAQPGGRDSQTFSFYWRPVRAISASFGYSHADVTRLTSSNLANYNRSLLFGNISFGLSKGSRINLRYTDQSIESAFPGSSSKFDIQNRSLQLGYNARYGRMWSNTANIRLNFSREANAGASLERGFSLSEQLRLTWRGGSLTGFAGYNHRSPSLTSMIVRNPQLLPTVLQTAFALDPGAFLQTYRDRLSYLLGGIDLPQTRSFNAGIRFQKNFSRLTVMSETRYDTGEISSSRLRNLNTSVNLGVRLDNANSIEVSGWRSVTGSGSTGLTFSYTHRFGASGDGFQFSRLLGFRKGRVRGRVYNDLNSNGVPDAGEPGIAGLKIQIDDKQSTITDKDGKYEMRSGEGRHVIALRAATLGVNLLADTPVERTVDLDWGQNLDINFGVRDQGSISGRIFNDAEPSLAANTGSSPGLGGVKIILRPADPRSGSFTIERTTTASGAYEFSNLRPGKYMIEIDPQSIPANYEIPAITATTITIGPLQTENYDVPVAAQRAISGIVYKDKDGDGLYNPRMDEPMTGVTVSTGSRTATTNAEGQYILRNLPGGRSVVIVRIPDGQEVEMLSVQLGSEPVIQRGVDLAVKSGESGPLR